LASVAGRAFRLGPPRPLHSAPAHFDAISFARGSATPRFFGLSANSCISPRSLAFSSVQSQAQRVSVRSLSVEPAAARIAIRPRNGEFLLHSLILERPVVCRAANHKDHRRIVFMRKMGAALHLEEVSSGSRCRSRHHLATPYFPSGCGKRRYTRPNRKSQAAWPRSIST